jgi:hypothetical protein
MSDLKIDFFENGLERIREMKRNMEDFAEDAKTAGLSDLPFDDWRKKLDRWERHFQGRILQIRDADRT